MVIHCLGTNRRQNRAIHTMYVYMYSYSRYINNLPCTDFSGTVIIKTAQGGVNRGFLAEVLTHQICRATVLGSEAFSSNLKQF